MRTSGVWSARNAPAYHRIIDDARPDLQLIGDRSNGQLVFHIQSVECRFIKRFQTQHIHHEPQDHYALAVGSCGGSHCLPAPALYKLRYNQCMKCGAYGVMIIHSKPIMRFWFQLSWGMNTALAKPAPYPNFYNLG